MSSLPKECLRTRFDAPQAPVGRWPPSPSRKFRASHPTVAATDCTVKPPKPTTTERCSPVCQLFIRAGGIAIRGSRSGTSLTAHEVGLRRIKQAEGKLISQATLWLQRDWNRKKPFRASWTCSRTGTASTLRRLPRRSVAVAAVARCGPGSCLYGRRRGKS